MATKQSVNIKEAIDSQKGLSGFALIMFVLSAALMWVDGYDNSTLSMTVSAMAHDWGYTRADFGWVMSVQNIGLIFGAFIFGWIGDRIGRKKTIMAALVLFGACTIGCTLTTDLWPLAIMRLVTSLGVGGITPCIVAINNDYAPEHSKMKRVTTLFFGMNFGSATSGLIAAALLGPFGWKAIYYFGGIAPFILLVFVVPFIPESISWLTLNKPDTAGPQILKALKKIAPSYAEGCDENTKFEWNVAVDKKKKQGKVSDLLEGKLKWVTPLLWANFIICLFIAYFFRSWIPTILVMKGMTDAEAAAVFSIMMFGSMAGSLTVGFVLDKIGLRKAAIFPIGVFIFANAFGLAPTGLAPFLIIGLGFFQSYSYDVNPSMTPLFYPLNLRSTASGLNLGIGRIGSLIAPYVGGLMLATGWTAPMMLLCVTIPEFASMAIIFAMMTAYNKHFRGMYAGEGEHAEPAAVEAGPTEEKQE